MTRNDELFAELNRKGRYIDLINKLEEVIPTIKSFEERINLEIQLAEACYSARKFKRAKRISEDILQRMDPEKHLSQIGNVENVLGKVYRIFQRYDEAINHYKKAENVFKQTHNIEGLSKVYHNLGNVYVLLEGFKRAYKYHTEALELAMQTDNKYSIASSHLNIGSLYYQDGEVDKAQSHFELAKALLEKIHDEPTLTATLINLAEVYFLRRDYKKSSEFSYRAASFCKDHKNVIGLRLALTTLARSEKAQGSIKKAIETYNEIISLDPMETSEEIYLELGESYLAQNHLSEAKIVYEKILTLPKRTLRGIGYSLDYLARIAIDESNFDEARRLYSQLLRILHDIEPQDKASIASTQGNLGFMYLKIGNFALAWEFLDHSFEFFKKRKDLDELFTLANNYLNEFVLKKEFNQAIQLLNDYIIPVAKKSKNKLNLNQYYYKTALIYNLKGEKEKALRYWKENHEKKIQFQKLSTPFLRIPNLDQETKKELENQHKKFIKLLIHESK